MTDSLRDRIAAALADEFEGQARKFDDASWGDVADVVIAELGLTKIIDVNRSVPRSRYVTRWSRDTPT